MAKEKIVKARFSLQGWDIKEWLKGNWNTILEVCKVGAPLVLGLEFFRNDPALIALATGLGKLILDGIHYWINEKKA